MTSHLLQVENLTVSYRQGKGWLEAVRNVSLSIAAGEIYALVGESGSGKSTLALAIMNYLSENCVVRGGSVRLRGRELTALSKAEMRQFWQNDLRLIPQNPLASLNPTWRIREQMVEALALTLSREKLDARLLELLAMVRLPDAERILNSYPHQLSGGQQQRILIAMALSGEPALLVMDEPTTNLDVTTEAAILQLIQDLIAQSNTAVLYVTHNLGVVAQMCHRVAVLYGGELVEDSTVLDLFQRPSHPYTRALLKRVPRLGDHKTKAEGISRHQGAEGLDRPTAPQDEKVLEVINLKKEYGLGRYPLQVLMGLAPKKLLAVNGVDLQIRRRETIGLVGESGSGKSTFARCIMGLIERDGGDIRILDIALAPALAQRDRRVLRHLQMVLQSADEALNPYITVGDALRRPLMRLAGNTHSEADQAVVRLLMAVKLSPTYGNRMPHQLSGGEKQRVAIARAFASQPDLLLLDESLSGLDVSVQAVILDLLHELQQENGSAYLFISHDLAVVSYLADSIAVIYLGHLLEIGRTEQILMPPYHPYTEALLSAVPLPDPTANRHPILLEGDVPSATDLPSGCPFHTRCHRRPLLFDPEICVHQKPPWRINDSGNRIYCHIPLDQLRDVQHQVVQLEE